MTILTARLERDIAKRAGLALLAALGVLATFVLLFFVGVGCPFARIFHVPCPACGSTRAIRALAALDVGAALRWNPVASIVTGLLAILCVRLVYVVARDGSARALADGAFGRAMLRALVVAVAVEIVVWALRFFGAFGGPIPV